MDGSPLPTDKSTDGEFLIKRKPVSTAYTPQLLDTPNLENVQSSSLRSDRRRRGTRFHPLLVILKHPWFTEISSLFIAWLCLAAIILTLGVHQYRPLPQWPNWISINSLIAIFSAILKAALVMPVAEGLGQLKWNWFRQTRTLIDLDRLDIATRGPWGALLLLIKRFRSRLACLGALITVCALAIDPFSQQVIQHTFCVKAQPGSPARVFTSTNYTKGGGYTTSTDRVVDRTMASAIFAALIEPGRNASASMRYECSTGNCTFNAVRGISHISLAICGKCQDLSHTIVQIPKNSTESRGRYSMPSTFDPDWPQHEDLFINELSIKKVNGNDSTSAPNGIADDGGGQPFKRDLTDNWFSIRPYSPWSPQTRYISAFDAIMYNNCNCTAGGCACTTFAANCALYPCVKAYRASVDNGFLNETEVPIETIPLTSVLSTAHTWTVNQTVRDGKQFNCTKRSTPSQDYSRAVASDWSPTQGFHFDYYPEGCLWQFDWYSTKALRAYFDKLWTGGLTGTMLSDSSEVVGDIWHQTMFNGGRANITWLEAYIDTLASSMTAVVRRYGNAPLATRTFGEAQMWQPCVQVRWSWLALPLILLLLACVFLAGMIWTTKGKHNTSWKSSPLALLFHGLDLEPQEKERYDSLMQLESMRQAARSVNVRMEPSSTGWQLVIK